MIGYTIPMVLLTLCVRVLICGDTDIDYTRTLHHATWAHFLHHEKKYDEAGDWYSSLIQQPASIYSLKGYILFLFDRQQYAKIMSYKETIQTQFASDVDMQRVFAHALAHSGKLAEADTLFITLNKTFPTNPDIALEAIKALTRKGDTESALAVTHAIINKTAHKASVFLFFFVQAQLYVTLKKTVQAREALQQCLVLRPQFSQGWLLMSLLEAQEGNADKATQGYQSFLRIGGAHNKELEQYLLALAAQHAVGTRMQAAAVYTHSAAYKKALVFHKERQFPRALAVVEAGIKQEPHNPHMKMLKIQILLDMQQAPNALAQLVAWIDQEPEQQLWFSLVHLLTHQHIPVQTAIDTLASVQKRMPDSLWVHLYLADLYMRMGQHAHAATCFERGVQITKDPVLKAELYFSQALLQYEQRAFDAARVAIEHGLAESVVHAPLYNIAAYYYATKGNDLTKAQNYIEQALAQEPDNVHYRDTQAVVWYKLQVYDKAEALLDQLHVQMPTDATVTLNLAKTKYKLGKKEEACTLVTKARSTVHHTHEHHTIARLEKKWHQTY
jgi:predicted Zn-dependent protease